MSNANNPNFENLLKSVSDKLGKTPEELIPLLKGIQCRGGTSCGDQFAQALEKYVEEHKKV